MFCANCGKQIADNEVFCPHCGHKNDSANQRPTQQNSYQQPTASTSTSTSFLSAIPQNALWGFMGLFGLIAMLFEFGTDSKGYYFLGLDSDTFKYLDDYPELETMATMIILYFAISLVIIATALLWDKVEFLAKNLNLVLLVEGIAMAATSFIALISMFSFADEVSSSYNKVDVEFGAFLMLVPAAIAVLLALRRKKNNTF